MRQKDIKLINNFKSDTTPMGEAPSAPFAMHNITPGAIRVASIAASKENLKPKCSLTFF
jgi:hypothetical protein